MGALGRSVRAVRLVRSAYACMRRFDAGSTRIEDLPALVRSRMADGDPRPALSLENLSRFVFLFGRVPTRLPQSCFARVRCLAEHWSPAYGEPTIHVGVASSRSGAARGHIWLTVDGALLWNTDVKASRKYDVLLREEGMLRYWYAKEETPCTS